MSGDKLKFLDYRKPRLEAGEYTVEVTQTYANPKESVSPKAVTSGLTFRVAGDQIRLTPQQVFAKYPPAGVSGDFSDTLPHIALHKGTLPWERSAYIYDEDALYTSQSDIETFEPWLYLMVVNDDDISRGDAKRPQTRQLASVIDNSDGAYLPQPFVKRLKNNADDQILQDSEEVLTVDIKASFFRRLIADRKQDLQYLAHVRQRLSEDEIELKRELSVVIANRFARANNQKYPMGMANYALLVSLEQYLNNDARVDSDDLSVTEVSNYVTGSDTEGKPLDQLGENDYVRLIVLTHWSFTSKDTTINFETRSQALDVGSLRLPSKESSPEHLFLPDLRKRDSGTAFDDRLQAGMTAILHQFRLGDQSLSWYRGPFAPLQASSSTSSQLSDYERGKEPNDVYVATDADRLLHYYKSDGMLDISYAAAYELGRFLALRNPDYAKALYEYKRGRARHVTLEVGDEERKQGVTSKGINIKQLPYAKLDPTRQLEHLAVIKQYLVDLGSFKDIPIWYLIPDHQLVPERTIRTFALDFKWIESLWLGALSLSGRPQITYLLYEELYAELAAGVSRSGFFVRSDLVWAYPEMNIEAKQIVPNAGDELDINQLRATHGSTYTDFIERKVSAGQEQVQSKQLEQRELGSDLLMMLVTDQDAAFNYVSLSLVPEALHYGADVTAVVADGETQYQYEKSIKYKGRTVTTLENIQVDSEGVVNIEQLASDIQQGLINSPDTMVDAAYKNGLTVVGSGRLSRYMLEGEPKVEFSLGGTK